MREARRGGLGGHIRGRVEDGCDAAAGVGEENGRGGRSVGHGTAVGVSEEEGSSGLGFKGRERRREVRPPAGGLEGGR
jgi:hypothetical protein